MGIMALVVNSKGEVIRVTTASYDSTTFMEVLKKKMGCRIVCMRVDEG